jgi:hypothetical protein
MTMTEQDEELHVTTVEIEGRTYNVSLKLEQDEVECTGLLHFTDAEWDDDGVVDHHPIPGRDANDILQHSKQLAVSDLHLRFKRAQADHRRVHGLRRITSNVLEHIRHLNRVATSMRAGLLDMDEAAAEIDETEQRLHAMIDELKHYAGVAG